MTEDIHRKIKTLCNKKGYLNFKIIDNKCGTQYNELNIITKKNIINNMKNTVILVKSFGGYIIEIPDTRNDLNEFINDMDEHSVSTILLKNKDSNRLFDDTCLWIKLYNDVELTEEFSILSLGENIRNIKEYFEDKIVLYAINNNIPLPLVDFNDTNNVRQILKDLTSTLRIDEIMQILY